jgi:adenylosuccinate lyase
MIARYTRPQMGALWSEQTKFETWLMVELAVLRAQEKLNAQVPSGCADAIEAACRGKLNPTRITEIENEVQHDVIAFTTHVAELAGDPAKYFHLGLTSSDVLDTALGLTIKKGGEILADDVNAVLQALEQKARHYARLLMMGRTHGVHAEPTTLGLKLALCWDEIHRGGERLTRAVSEAAVGKISGAVGNYTQMDPQVEVLAGEYLNLPMAPISSQIVTRDRHAALLCAMAVLAGSLERLATEVRLLQHSEIGELAEPFGKKQKGSSAMPHKRNPIVCERICGLARLMRGYAQVAMENQALWHERDISHSGTERVILPDAFTVLDYMLERTAWLVNGLEVNEKRIAENLTLTHEIYQSQSILTYLLGRGMSREEAYRIVQKAAFAALEAGKSLRETINPELPSPIPPTDLNTIFSPDRFTRHVDEILARLWKS